MATRRLQAERSWTGSVHRPKTGVLPTVLRNHICRKIGRDEAAAAVFAFWLTLTYFCDCDTHLNNELT